MNRKQFSFLALMVVSAFILLRCQAGPKPPDAPISLDGKWTMEKCQSDGANALRYGVEFKGSEYNVLSMEFTDKCGERLATYRLGGTYTLSGSTLNITLGNHVFAAPNSDAYVLLFNGTNLGKYAPTWGRDGEKEITGALDDRTLEAKFGGTRPGRTGTAQVTQSGEQITIDGTTYNKLP